MEQTLEVKKICCTRLLDVTCSIRFGMRVLKIKRKICYRGSMQNCSSYITVPTSWVKREKVFKALCQLRACAQLGRYHLIPTSQVWHTTAGSCNSGYLCWQYSKASSLRNNWRRYWEAIKIIHKKNSVNVNFTYKEKANYLPVRINN